MGQSFHRAVIQRGIGGDDSVDGIFDQDLGDGLHLLRIQIRGDLHQQRYIASMPFPEQSLLLLQRPDQAGKDLLLLQFPQPRGIGGGDVQCDVAGEGIDLAHAVQVVLHSLFHRGVEILADIDP